MNDIIDDLISKLNADKDKLSTIINFISRYIMITKVTIDNYEKYTESKDFLEGLKEMHNHYVKMFSIMSEALEGKSELIC
jgi:hypothetical protein